jgi:hypothetical protein
VAVAEADSLAQALSSKEQLATTAERRAESLSRHASELAEQLAGTQRAAAAAQAERDAAAAQVGCYCTAAALSTARDHLNALALFVLGTCSGRQQSDLCTTFSANTMTQRHCLQRRR